MIPSSLAPHGRLTSGSRRVDPKEESEVKPEYPAETGRAQPPTRGPTVDLRGAVALVAGRGGDVDPVPQSKQPHDHAHECAQHRKHRVRTAGLLCDDQHGGPEQRRYRVEAFA